MSQFQSVRAERALTDASPLFRAALSRNQKGNKKSHPQARLQ